MEPAKAGVVNHSHISAKAAVVRADGKVLVIRRSKDDADSPGRLDLPGGGIESGESYAQAVAREISEEAGITVAADDLVLSYAFTRYDEAFRSARIRLLYTVAVIDPVVQLSHEHDEYWWHTPQELVELFAEISWGEAIRSLYAHELNRMTA